MITLSDESEVFYWVNSHSLLTFISDCKIEDDETIVEHYIVDLNKQNLFY